LQHDGDIAEVNRQHKLEWDYARAKVNQAFSTIKSHGAEGPLHRRFAELCEWPQWPEAILCFSREFGPLFPGHVSICDPRKLIESPGATNIAERPWPWFLGVRRIQAICLLLWLEKLTDPCIDLPIGWEHKARKLARCSEDLFTYGDRPERGLDEPLQLSAWHTNGVDGVENYLLAIRRGGRARIDTPFAFGDAAKSAFEFLMTKHSSEFRIRLNPERGFFRVEAISLLGAIYASLYDEVMSIDGNLTCAYCRRRFEGRADAKCCSGSCRKGYKRLKDKQAGHAGVR